MNDILVLESKLQQKEDTINENERGLSFNRDFFFDMDQSYLVYDCKLGSFNFTAGKITTWKSAGIFNYFGNSNMNYVADSGKDLPVLKNDGRMHVYLNGNHFQENKVIIPNNNNVINIYCVYQIEPISSSRDDTFTVENALFGALQITINADTSKYKYKGYGICFDEGGLFSIGNINNGRNVTIFEYMKIQLFIQIIKQIIYLLWVMLLCKVLTIQHCMHKKCIVKTLLSLVQNSY